MKEENSEEVIAAYDKNKYKQFFIYPKGHFTAIHKGDNFDNLGILKPIFCHWLVISQLPAIFSDLSISLGGRKTNIAIRSHTIPILDDTAKDPDTQRQYQDGMKKNRRSTTDVPKWDPYQNGA